MDLRELEEEHFILSHEFRAFLRVNFNSEPEKMDRLLNIHHQISEYRTHGHFSHLVRHCFRGISEDFQSLEECVQALKEFRALNCNMTFVTMEYQGYLKIKKEAIRDRLGHVSSYLVNNL